RFGSPQSPRANQCSTDATAAQYGPFCGNSHQTADRKMSRPWSGIGSRVLDPSQQMARNGDQLIVLVDHLDVGDRLTLRCIDLRDRVGETDRVADMHGTEKANAVVTERHRSLVARRAVTF